STADSSACGSRSYTASPGRPGAHPHRAAQHHADQDRRAHGNVEAHIAARHHRASRGYDEGGEDARTPQGYLPAELRLLVDVPAVHRPRLRGRIAPISAAQRLA